MSKLIVEKASVFIKKLQSKVLLNFVSLADEEWMQDTYGKERLKVGLHIDENLDMEMLLGIFWRLMDDDSKRKIIALKIHEMDGLQDKGPISFDDPVKKLKYIVGGVDEVIGIMAALGETRVKSNNKPEDVEKKSPRVDTPLTSTDVSTSSQVSTDTQSKNLNS